MRFGVKTALSDPQSASAKAKTVEQLLISVIEGFGFASSESLVLE